MNFRTLAVYLFWDFVLHIGAFIAIPQVWLLFVRHPTQQFPGYFISTISDWLTWISLIFILG